MGLFSQAKMDEINAIAEKSKEVLKPIKVSKSVTSSQHEIQESIKAVQEYFKDSPAILITSKAQLHEYVLKAIESGYCAIDTETTGLDRVHDTIVGASLYYPGGVECYIPCKHLAPVFEVPYENQVSYEDLGSELAYFVEAKTKMIFANADFDLAMIYKDLKVDLIPVCYYDVITAWRCIKEDELDNRLKALYMKYVKKGKGDPKSFSDFFSPKLFPYCPTDVAKLYAANDAKITYELFFWQLPYVTKTHPKCQKHKLEKIADLIWNIEIPMIRVCALMHRTGVYFDKNIRDILKIKYDKKYQEELNKLSEIIQEIMDNSDAITVSKSPFKNGAAFNEASPKQVTYLLNNFLHCDVSSGDKATLTELNLPVTNQILKVRALNKLLNAFVDKLPNEVGKDGRIHATFKSIGADTGRMSSSEPNVQQIPSHALDIRHQFRATPAKEKHLQCTIIDQTATFTLDSYDSVTLFDSNVQCDVIDLTVGNKIVLYNTNESYLVIQDIIHTLPTTKLKCHLEGRPMDTCYVKHIAPPYVMMSSDFSQQEPKLTAFVSSDPNMIDAFKHNRDIYSTIAALAFNKTYEECSEHFFDANGNKTDEVNREGKERRSQAKSIVLGILYGRSTKTIGDQLFGGNKQMTDEQRTKEAQVIYDAVLNAFPNLRAFMIKAQSDARKYGYVETILGRRRHIPDMQLKPYEFKAAKGYINPDIDPLDPSTLNNKNEIPERIVKKLEEEFNNYKYYGQVVKATKRLQDEHIKVINNSRKITDASRKCVNCVDYDTEILTTSGWKKYNEVNRGDAILAYSLDCHEIVKDNINEILNYPGYIDAIQFETPTFSSVSTLDHRWVVCESDEIPRIKTTADINNHKWPDYPILRIADNAFEENLNITDNQLKILGWIMTDGSIDVKRNSIHLYQSTNKTKNRLVYEDMIATLKAADIEITDACRDNVYHEIYLKLNDFVRYVISSFPDKVLTFDFINTLSERQAEILMHAMLQGDGTGVDGHGAFCKNITVSLCVSNKSKCDAFQYLCFIAGYATNAYEINNSTLDYPSNHIKYDSMGNIPLSNSTYYNVTVLKVQRAQIYPHHKSELQVPGVWCVNTNTGTWIARRHGKVYITGNSIIQGSAADLTKMAMLKVFSNKEWEQLGAKVLLPVHDEIIAEVPIRNAIRASEILGKMMSEAGNFLPFPISCDVEITYKWYGLSFPCSYEQPNINFDSLNTLSESEIKWIQYHLFECEYTLPVYKDKDGKKPIGDAALGVNGIWSKEVEDAMYDYIHKYKIAPSDFVDNIHHRVNGDVIN